MNEITIVNSLLPIRELNGQRVVTFKDIDTVHKRPEGTASRNFKTNRKHFIESVDYFIVKPSDFQKDEIRPFEIPNRGLTLLTESGYLMIVKSFADDLSWDVQRMLVNNYFKKTVAEYGQIPAAALQSIEKRLEALEKAATTPADKPEALPEVATSFLQAIQGAIDSGEYCIKRKFKHTPEKSEILGRTEYDTVVIRALIAYKIYADTVPDPLPRLSLWNVLEYAGAIRPRREKPHEISINGKRTAVIYIPRDKLQLK